MFHVSTVLRFLIITKYSKSLLYVRLSVAMSSKFELQLLLKNVCGMKISYVDDSILKF